MSDTSQYSVTRDQYHGTDTNIVSLPKKKAMVQASCRYNKRQTCFVSTIKAIPPKGVSLYNMKADQITSELIAWT